MTHPAIRAGLGLNYIWSDLLIFFTTTTIFPCSTETTHDVTPFYTPLLVLQTSGWYLGKLELRCLDFGAITLSGLYCQIPSEAHVSLCCTCGKVGLSGEKKIGGRQLMKNKGLSCEWAFPGLDDMGAGVLLHYWGNKLRWDGVCRHELVVGVRGRGVLGSWGDAGGSLKPHIQGIIVSWGQTVAQNEGPQWPWLSSMVAVPNFC